MNASLWHIALCLLCLQCVHQPKLAEERPAAKNNKEEFEAATVGNAETEEAYDLVPVSLPDDPCIEFSADGVDIPYYHKELGFMITKLEKTCLSRNGLKGYEKNTDWMAMSLPCTNGGGKVDISGNMYRPKNVQFLFTTTCPTTAHNQEFVEEEGQKAMGKDFSGKLLAINPFMVQFWRIDGHPDMGIGNRVGFETQATVANLWKELTDNTAEEKKKFKVHLYGRENSWTAEHLFHITGEVELINFSTFKFTPLEATTMREQEEIDIVKKSCMENFSIRDCSEIF